MPKLRILQQTRAWIVLGRRVKRQVVDNLNPTQSYTRSFYYDRDQIVEERDENNRSVTRYMNGVGIDDPLLLMNSSGVYGYTKDGLGSIKELVKLDQQVPHQRYSYSSYGMTTEALEVVTSDKKLIENRYAYTGRELEPETGLYYYRARYYDPEMGRFLNEDPIGFGGGDTNLYRYVFNNPVSFVDPFGLDACGYSQTSGQLVCIGNDGNLTIVTNGYSGNGPGKNNPVMQGEQNVGPIPTGQYTVGPGYSSSHGPMTRPLTPNRTTFDNFPPDRDPKTFLMHGDSIKNPGNGSQGCMIINSGVRSTLPSGSTINVVP